jgi:hypothetical protein
LTLFLPMPIEIEIMDGSPEEAFLAECIRIDLNRECKRHFGFSPSAT